MSRSNTRSCTGTCGARQCVGWITWGRPIGVGRGDRHPVTGQFPHVRSGTCSLCEHAHAARVRVLLDSSDGYTARLFSLVDGGGSA